MKNKQMSCPEKADVTGKSVEAEQLIEEASDWLMKATVSIIKAAL